MLLAPFPMDRGAVGATRRCSPLRASQALNGCVWPHWDWFATCPRRTSWLVYLSYPSGLEGQSPCLGKRRIGSRRHPTKTLPRGPLTVVGDWLSNQTGGTPIGRGLTPDRSWRPDCYWLQPQLTRGLGRFVLAHGLAGSRCLRRRLSPYAGDGSPAVQRGFPRRGTPDARQTVVMSTSRRPLGTGPTTSSRSTPTTPAQRLLPAERAELDEHQGDVVEHQTLRGRRTLGTGPGGAR